MLYIKCESCAYVKEFVTSPGNVNDEGFDINKLFMQCEQLDKGTAE